jgi:hypothetical protein
MYQQSSLQTFICENRKRSSAKKLKLKKHLWKTVNLLPWACLLQIFAERNKNQLQATAGLSALCSVS